jgi:SAM-dependent methyltransferase
VPDAATIRYVDHLTADQLRDEYPELGDRPLVQVDLVDDGERLDSIPAQSQDFVIASHFLEHCEDPIGALQAHLRTLRAGGTLLLALPDRRSGIDERREATTLDHLIADHEEGPQRSRAEHYADWSRLVDLPLGNVAADNVGAPRRGAAGAALQHPLPLLDRGRVRGPARRDHRPLRAPRPGHAAPSQPPRVPRGAHPSVRRIHASASQT